VEEAEVIIQKLSKKGDGIGFINDTKVEVPRTIIGDTVVAELYRKRRGVRRGKLLKVVKPSEDRVDVKCKHALFCGGCSLQQMAYTSQLKYKENFVRQIFSDYNDIELRPILFSDCWQYRNKMEFTFSENRAGMRYLGLMMGKMSRFVFNLEECFLASSWFSDTLASVRSWWNKNLALSAYNVINNTGVLKNLTLRESFSTKQKMVILTIVNNDLVPDQIQALVEAIGDRDVSIYVRKMTVAKKMATQVQDIHIHGPKTIEEVLNIFGKNFRFTIGPSSFFQPNTMCAKLIYEKALSLIANQKQNIVFDLYAGASTLGILFSSFANEVIGIEENAQAVNDGRNNINLNNINNITLHVGDVGDILQNISIRDPDLVILDPPRAGLNLKAISSLLRLAPKKIIYISCNPLTQHENIKELKGYALKSLQPVDQFPHTYHVENIAYLVRM